LAVAWETILGLWLIAGRARFAPWLAAVGTFAAFLLVSLYLSINRQPDCGCFGAVPVSPWVVFAIDLTALAVLFVARPAPPQAWRTEVSGSRWAIAAALAVFVLAATGWALYSSLDAALARLRGDSVFPLQSEIDVGPGKPGDRLEGRAVFVNLTDRPVRLVGYRSECGCLTTQDLPMTIPPGERSEVRLVLTVPNGSPGRVRRQVNFVVEGNPLRTIRISVAGEVQQ
jgi:hypothetical protein